MLFYCFVAETFFYYFLFCRFGQVDWCDMAARGGRHIDYVAGNAQVMANQSEKPGTKKSYNTYRKKWYSMVGKDFFSADDLSDDNMAMFLSSLWLAKVCFCRLFMCIG